MKKDRRAKILDIICTRSVTTQSQLTKFLQSEGYEVTQATVSRDIKDLRLVKVMDKQGNYKYAPTNAPEEDHDMYHRFVSVLEKSVTNIKYANNMVVIKTLPGMAQGAAMAVDTMKWGEVVGTLAGDDTVFVVAYDSSGAQRLVKKLEDMIKS